MDKPIQVKHDDVLITYDERDDQWKFTLRGRDRSAPSLAKAREFIDKPLPAEKAKPFEKIPAWYIEYSDTPEKIEVTGIAERGYSNLEHVWVNRSGRRCKEGAHYIYPCNPKNDALAAQMIANKEEEKKLNDQFQKMRAKLDKLVLPKDE